MSEFQPARGSKRRRSRRRPRRKRRVALVALVLAAASLVLFVPNLAAWFFSERILAVVSQRVNGRLAADSVSLGWFQPVELYKPVAFDAEGEPLFEAQQLTIQKSLLGLILERRKLGTITLHQPQLDIVVWDGGSNIETFLEPLLAEPPSDEPLEVAWHLDGGEVLVRHGPSNESARWTIETLSGNLLRADHLHVSLDGTVHVTAGDESGSLKFQTASSVASEYAEASSEHAHESFDVYWEADRLPLSSINPILARFASDTRVSGRLSGTAHATWEPEQHRGRLESLESRIEQPRVVRLSSEARILELANLQIAGDAEWNEARLDLNRLAITSDVGSLHAKAELPLDQDSGLLKTSQQLLAVSKVQIDADVQLAALANAAPHLLRLRDDVSLSAGSVKLELHSEPQAGQSEWTATLSTSDVRGERAGQPFTWTDPIQAEVALRWTGSRIVFDHVECRSEFLVASLEGSPNEGSITAEANLDRFAERLAQFVDLRGIEIQGTLDGRTKWQRDNNRMNLESRLALDSLVVSLPDRPTWSEPQLSVSLNIAGELAEHGQWTSLEQAQLELVAPAERMTLVLDEPVRAPPLEAPWNFTLAVSSKLEKWLPRLVPIIDLQLGDVAGILEVNGRLTVAEPTIELHSLVADIEELLVDREGIRIDEPRAVISAAGTWSRTNKRWTTRELKVQTSALAIGSQKLDIDAGGREQQIVGSLTYTSDLERFAKWLKRPQPVTHQVRGELVGHSDLQVGGGQTQLDTQIDITHFQLLAHRQTAGATTQPVSAPGGWIPLWNEPKFSLAGRSRWDSSNGKLVLTGWTAAGEGMQFTTQGELEDLWGRMQVDLEGSVRYDLAVLTPKLRNLAFENLTLAGTREQPFALKGPLRHPPTTVATSETASLSLVPPELTGRASLGWQSANILGIVVGTAEVRAELDQARLQFVPLDFEVSGGRLVTAPWVDLTQSPARLVHPPGTLLQNVQLSPDMTRSWLQYVAPTIANATTADGEFSVTLDRLSMPLGVPQQADIGGALVIEQARVGPGPLSQSILTVAERLAALANRRLPISRGQQWLELPAQQIPFELDNGRVTHRDLRMRVGDLEITSEGWVALDRRISLTMRIPIHEDWVRNNRLLSGLAGTTVSVPISGTLDQPQLDDRVFRELGRDAVENAAGGLLRGLIERQLRRNDSDGQ